MGANALDRLQGVVRNQIVEYHGRSKKMGGDGLVNGRLTIAATKGVMR